NGRERLSFKAHSYWITQIAFGPGQRVATSSGDGTVRVWDATTGNRLLDLVGDGEPVYSVAVSHDGTIATGGSDGVARLWDSSGRYLKTLRGHARQVNKVAFSLDGLLLATAGGQDGTVKLWEVATGRLLRTLSTPGTSDFPTFSPDGTRLAAAGGGIIQLWDTASGRALIALT